MIRILLATDQNDVAHLKVTTLGGLPIFPEFRLIGQFDGHLLAVHVGDLDRPVSQSGDLAEHRHLLAIAAL